MITENELRDGNYVLYKDERSKHNTADLVQIDGVVAGWVVIDQIKYGTDDHRYQTKDIYPVPLTDDLLLQFGFIHKSNKNDWMECKELWDLRRTNGMIRFELTDLPHIKYLHQLQNLYHALTGQELEMKPAK